MLPIGTADSSQSPPKWPFSGIGTGRLGRRTKFQPQPAQLHPLGQPPPLCKVNSESNQNNYGETVEKRASGIAYDQGEKKVIHSMTNGEEDQKQTQRSECPLFCLEDKVEWDC